MRRYHGNAQFVLNAASSPKGTMAAQDEVSVSQGDLIRDILISPRKSMAENNLRGYDIQTVAQRMSEWGSDYNAFCYKRHPLTGRRLPRE